MPASYPTSIKSFLTYHDQPSNPSLIVPDPDNPNGTVDLTIDRAKITNEIHDEIIAVEKTVGVTGASVTVVPGTTNLGGEINFLYNNKSSGRADPISGAIYPLPPPSHNHLHASLDNLGDDVHPQYIRTDGARGFTAPVSAPNAAASNQLATLGQAESFGYLTAPQVVSSIQTEIHRKSPYPMTGPIAQRAFRIAGGFYYGPSDDNGNVWIDYSRANFAGILTFIFMKNAFPGESMLGWYTFQYPEDQIILLSVANNGAMVQFVEDIVVDRRALVALTWMVLGV